MGKLFLKEKICCFIISALMVSYSAAEIEFFYQPINKTWDEARQHCQVCFKDLVTLTPENSQAITKKVKSLSWVGLRKNSNICDKAWTRWANGDPLSFQNWYPGQPASSFPCPKRDCCSCSCTCQQPTTTQSTTTQSTTSQRVTDITQTDTSSFNKNIMTTQQTDSSNATENPTENTTNMSNFTKPNNESCVAMLSFGAWKEENCSERLHFVCYDERFVGEVTVTNVTLSSANLTWTRGPVNTTHYRVEVNDQNGTLEIPGLTYNLRSLTAGSHHSVKVFAVKCNREFNPLKGEFYTTPNKVGNLMVTDRTTTSISLNWTNPGGKIGFYETHLGDTKIESATEGAVVTGLKPGYLYTFTVISGVEDRSQWSDNSTISAYTKPGKVSGLKATEITNTSLLLTWTKPDGNSTSYFVEAVDVDSNHSRFNKTVVNETRVRVNDLLTGSRVTLSVTAMVNGSVSGDVVTIHCVTAPGPISNLILTSTHDKITATWKPPNGNFSSFSAELQRNGTNEVTKNNTTEPKIDFKGLKSGAKYSVTIRTVSGDLESPPVTEYIFTTPMPPTDPTVTDSDKNTITFAWKAPVNSATSKYFVRINSSFWGQNFEYKVDQPSYKFEGLNSGTNYMLTVKTGADPENSSAVSLTHFTEHETREISLSMLCSSAQSLLCDTKDSREKVFRELKEKIRQKLGDMVFWEFEW